AQAVPRRTAWRYPHWPITAGFGPTPHAVFGVAHALPEVPDAVAESFLHLVYTPFHEAGHVFFAPLGDFVRVLGGTLGLMRARYWVPRSCWSRSPGWRRCCGARISFGAR